MGLIWAGDLNRAKSNQAETILLQNVGMKCMEIVSINGLPVQNWAKIALTSVITLPVSSFFVLLFACNLIMLYVKRNIVFC